MVRAMSEATEKRKPGPVRGEPTKQYPVLLPEELGEWAKHQPEGLSALVRRLLREAKQRAERQK